MRSSVEYKKCLNLIEIFEGTVPVTFYDNSSKEYHTHSVGVALSEFLMQEFVSVVGSGNAVFKN